MNWVGGSRNRNMLKNDTRKQREFFEKGRLQQRIKKLGIPQETSGRGSSSTDLLTLFIVNQIASKKQTKDPPKITDISRSKQASKALSSNWKPLELPMSPCSPSQLHLVESQPYYSARVGRKRSLCFPEGFRCRQLSPVLESAFSDGSPSDYQLHLKSDLHSPFSTSSGQGVFPLKPGHPQSVPTHTPLHARCPASPPWGTPGLHRSRFRPFSRPRVLGDCAPWPSGAGTSYQLAQTPALARVLFGSPTLDNIASRDQSEREDSFSFIQSKNGEPPLGFALDPAGVAEQFEEDLFSGFSNNESSSEASHYARSGYEIHPEENTQGTFSGAQSFLSVGDLEDPESSGTAADFQMKVSSRTTVDPSRPGHKGTPKCGESSPGYSSRSSCYLSDSGSDEDGCQQCLLSESKAFRAESLNQESLWPGLAALQDLPQTVVSTPQRKFPGNHQTLKNTVSPDNKGCSGSDKARSVVSSPHPMTPSQGSDPRRDRTAEAETQTPDTPQRQTADASTQWSPESGRQPTAWYGAAGSGAVPNLASRGKSGCRDADPEKNPLGLWSAPGVEGRAGNLLNKTPRGGLHMADGQAEWKKDRGIVEEERGTTGLLIEDPAEERTEVRSAGPASRLSEEVGTLQEIANVLLMLRQRKREG